MNRKIESLDEWIAHISSIYEQSNGERDFKDVLLFSFEEVGRCSQLINREKDNDILEHIPNLFKWFCILYAKSGEKEAMSDIVWNKFPGFCPYCGNTSCNCSFTKNRIDVKDLIKKADTRRRFKPKSLNDWQRMFEEIYTRNGDYKMEKNISHLFEELSELSEVHRLQFIEKDIDIVGMELADVFSWIMGCANYYDQRAKREKRHYRLQDALNKAFGEGICPECKDFASDHNINNCCCSIMPQRLKLISDYTDETDLDNNSELSTINKIKYD